ncbi:MAG: hypothetical protein ACFCGT_19500 [Sandaracinaceae bacterium]
MLRWLGRWGLALALGACSSPPVSRPDLGPLPDRGPPPVDDPRCGCATGLHNSFIFALSDQAELWTYDPLTDRFEFQVGPACGTALTPYSMAIDPKGNAFILDVPSRRMQVLDVNALGPCEDSGFVPTVREIPLFGMSFVLEDVETQCAGLFGQSYDGEGRFEEGDAIGRLVAIEGDPLRMRILGATDFNGGELAGTGDGRLFAFAGSRPAKLVEYDRTDATVRSVLELPGVSQTNASAFAFFGGDIFIFTEAEPAECRLCFERECAEAYAACQADEVCAEDLACALERGSISDDCGGLTGEEMHDCIPRCAEACRAPRARRSQVLRVDWDRSEGPEPSVTRVVDEAPIRVVGAASSPCVPVILD